MPLTPAGPSSSPVQPELPADVVALIGVRQHEAEADLLAEIGDGRRSCASVHNANPLFWDDEVAVALAGGPVLPPSTLSRWSRPLSWSPDEPEALPLRAHFDLKERLGLPDAIVSRSELILHEPVRPGDRIAHAQIVRSISEPKQTARGSGRFWVIDTEYRNQRDDLVGIEATTAFGAAQLTAPTATGSIWNRGRSEPVSDLDLRQFEVAEGGLGWAGRDGAGPRPLVHEVTTTTVVLGAAAAADWRPMHHDRRYAVDHSGTTDIFLDTPTQAAWFERVVTDWTGPSGRIGRLDVRMIRPVVPGDTMTLTATVRSVAEDEVGYRWVELAIDLTVGAGTASTGSVRVAVPVDEVDRPWMRRGDDWRP